MACHQINLPPMTSTSTRNISPGNQITQTCSTAGEETEINILFILRRSLETGQERQNEEGTARAPPPGHRLGPRPSDLRGRGVRNTRVVIASAALRRDGEGTSGEGRYLLFQRPLLDSFSTDTRRAIIACLFIPFKKGEKQHLKSQSGFGVNDYFSKP